MPSIACAPGRRRCHTISAATVTTSASFTCRRSCPADDDLRRGLLGRRGPAKPRRSGSYTGGSIWPENNPFLDDHVVYAIVLAGIAVVGAGRYLGLGPVGEAQLRPEVSDPPLSLRRTVTRRGSLRGASPSFRSSAEPHG